MIRKLFDFKLMLALIGVMTFANVELESQANAQEELPSADEVIARYVEVTGGIEKYKTIKSMHQKGTISIAMAGAEGRLEMKAVAPNKTLVQVDLGALGGESTGSDGTTAWSKSTMTGNRLLEGPEAEQAMMDADFRRIYEPASVYKSLKVVGVKDVDGEKCYQLKVVKKTGGEQQEFYSVETGLQKLSKIEVVSPMGKMNIEVTVSEYKEAGGIKFPHKLSQKFENGMIMEIVMDSIVLNTEIEDDTFAIPAEIQKLLDKKKTKAEKKANDKDKADDKDH